MINKNTTAMNILVVGSGFIGANTILSHWNNLCWRRKIIQMYLLWYCGDKSTS